MSRGWCCVALALVVLAFLRVESSAEGKITSALLEVNNAQLHLRKIFWGKGLFFVFRTTWYNFYRHQFFIETFALPRHVVDDV